MFSPAVIMLSQQKLCASTASCENATRHRRCIKYFQEKAYHMMDWLFFFILSKSGDNNKYKKYTRNKGNPIFSNALADMQLGICGCRIL